MDEADLILKLNNMYENAEEGYAIAMIHLFGIKYAQYIGKDKVATPEDIVKKSSIPNSYATEINKGKKLSKFVLIK